MVTSSALLVVLGAADVGVVVIDRRARPVLDGDPVQVPGEDRLQAGVADRANTQPAPAGRLEPIRPILPAEAQDRGGAVALIAVLRSLHPWLRHLFADGDYTGEKRQTALAAHGKWTIEVAKRSPGTKGFEVLPPAMGVQRTLAWLERCGRLAKDAEATVTRAKPMRVEPTFIDFALTA
jgi:transposase